MEILEKKSGDSGEYDSMSEAVRHFISEYEALEEELEEARVEIERLRNEKRLVLEEREEKQELVRYVETERTLTEQKARAGIVTRAKWWLTGVPDSGEGK
nr:CopG family transcriptional regulator [Natronococcus pandeyae]